MKLPRDLSGRAIAKELRRYGYVVLHETGSHMRVRTTQGGEHSVTIPDHDALRIGTLSGILGDVAAHLGIDRHALVTELFER